MEDVDQYSESILRDFVAAVISEVANAPRKGMKRRWSVGYKRSIDCSHPKGFSQKNYCKRQRRGGKYRDD